MLKRQKAILALLEAANRSISTLDLTKLVFLLRNETDLSHESSFYDFVPYLYGPFSFALFRELNSLKRYSYVSVQENQIRLVGDTRDITRKETATLSRQYASAVTAVLEDYGHFDTEALLSSVYSRYPWYTLNSKRKDLIKVRPTRPKAQLAVYTVGYEGKSVDGFFNGLLEAGMRAILDVRANPISRKYGFAQKSMRDIASKLDIEYCHFPKVGIPSTMRTDLSDADSYSRLFERYVDEILPSQGEQIKQLGTKVKSMPATLLCMEKEPQFCHRSFLADRVALVTGLPIINLP